MAGPKGSAFLLTKIRICYDFSQNHLLINDLIFL